MPSADFDIITQYEALAREQEMNALNDTSNHYNRRQEEYAPMRTDVKSEPDFFFNEGLCQGSQGQLDMEFGVAEDQFTDNFLRLIPTVALPQTYPPQPSTTTCAPSAPQQCPPVTTRTFAAGLNMSGGTVYTHPEYAIGVPAQPCTGESRDLLDLDNQTQSDSYYEFESIIKFGSSWDETCHLMLVQIQLELDDLGVPQDPIKWTAEHVRKWISWICQKNQKPDSSSKVNMNGVMLCSLGTNDLVRLFGDFGQEISHEIDLLKSANNVPSDMSPQDSYEPVSMSRQQLSDPYMETPQNFGCVSPAPSTSSSHDSMSTLSNISEDESGLRYSKNVPNITSQENYSRVPPKMPSGRGHKQTIHLWQFLKELLVSKENHTDCIRWLDRNAGIFKIEDSKKVATLWGSRKNRPAMNYDKLSRSVRQYYKKGIIKKTEQSKRLVYQFCAGYL